jgi:hypothetical protein
MLTQGEDVEAHALRERGWSISAIARHLQRDRKTVRSHLNGERQAGVRVSVVVDPLAAFEAYVRARFVDDPHLWASALFDEVAAALQFPEHFGENWDAFEAPPGQALWQLLDRSHDWSHVGYWLLDLSEELTSALKDGTLPPTLGLECVWITGDGRAILLDKGVPGLDVSASASISTQPGDVEPVKGFLQQVAVAALNGRRVGFGEGVVVCVVVGVVEGWCAGLPVEDVSGGEHPGGGIVIQVPARGLGAQPLPYQRRFHADLRGHLGRRQRPGPGEHRP